MAEISGNKKIGNKLGRLGEEIACKFLENKGFVVVCRNYQKKWGEIDIVSRNKGEIHFIEVKTVSCENSYLNVTHETVYKKENDVFRPEDNVHTSKLRRLKNTILTYLEEKKISGETLWCLDLIVIKVDLISRKAFTKMVSNIIL
jgi:putative endonuclease